MKKILVYGFSNTRGGIENYIVSMQGQLKDSIQFYYMIEKCNCIYKDDIQKYGGKIYFFSDSASAKKRIQSIANMLKRFRSMIDVLYINVSDISYQTLVTMMIGLRYKFHVVVHSHNAMLEPIQSRIHQVTHKVIENVCVLICKSQKITCLAVSDRAGKYLYKNGMYEIIHAGFNVRKYKFNRATRDRIRDNYNLGSSILYGFVGRLVPIKNPVFVIDVFKQIINLSKDKDLKLMIIGNGNLMHELRNKVFEEGIREQVIFTGEVTNVSDYLQALDLIISPSISEGMSLALVEAQAAGVPCVCSADRIPKDVGVTPLVEFLPLNKGAAFWAGKCVEGVRKHSDIDRTIWNDDILKTNFEVQKAALLLKEKLL